MGHLQTYSYEKNDGTRAFATNVMVESIEFDRKANDEKKENNNDKSDAEIVASVMKDDPFEKMGEQIALEDYSSDLPF